MLAWLRRVLGTLAGAPLPTAGSPPNLGQAPLFALSPLDTITIDDACQGILAFGGVGSGKTSGSGQVIARSLLRTGMGGVVMCAKSDEADRWRRYCAEEGRLDDLIVVSRQSSATINFVDYALKKSGGDVENAVNLFSRALEVGGRSRQNSRADPFWDDALRQLLRNAIALVSMASDTVSLMDLHELVQSAARSPEEARSPEWRENSACGVCLTAAELQTRGDHVRTHDYERTADYWLHEFPSIPDKTRNTIVASFTAVSDPFLRNPLYRLFCTTTTVTPEASFAGRIILLDLAIKTEGFSGRFAQVLIKLLWQAAAERRSGADGLFPTFLFSDEAHYFLTKSDQEFFTTARSARVISVLLTQTVSNVYAEFGDQRDAANAVLGTLNLRIFHANADPETNEWASRVIGQRWDQRIGFSRGTSSGAHGGAASESTSAQMNEQLVATVLPSYFINLPTGGPRNGFVVVGIACRSGAPWAYTGTNWLTVEFSQIP